MSDTAGGCVYDGRPLNGVGIHVDAGGRISLGGPTVATGYRNPVIPDPFSDPGWFRTDDLGVVDDSGVLRVLGRADDVVISGGVNVPTPAVAARLRQHPAVAAAEDCLRSGVRVGCFRPPTVPAGTSRLRLTARASLTDDEVRLARRVLTTVLASHR